MEFSLYDILGVDPKAEYDEIKKVYRRLAKKYHPDRNSHLDDEGRAEAEDCYKKIVEAWEVLSDGERRAAYDETGRTEAFKDELFEKAVEQIGDTLQKVITGIVAKNLSPATTDVMGIMLADFKRESEACVETKGKLKKTLAVIEGMSGRFTSEGQDNILNHVLSEQKELVLSDIERMDDGVRLLQRCQDILKLHGYNWIKPLNSPYIKKWYGGYTEQFFQNFHGETDED